MEVLTISKNDHQINDMIRDREVRLISASGEQLGVVPLSRAFDEAEKHNLDLVKIAPTASPPVCRVMDYGKFRFEQAKKEREARRNQNVVELKTVQLTVGIGDHDYNFKLKNALGFLDDGNKLKVSLRFRGRAITHSELGVQTLNRFAESCAEKGTVEKMPKLEGRIMTMIIAPKK